MCRNSQRPSDPSLVRIVIAPLKLVGPPEIVMSQTVLSTVAALDLSTGSEREDSAHSTVTGTDLQPVSSSMIITV